MRFKDILLWLVWQYTDHKTWRVSAHPLASRRNDGKLCQPQIENTQHQTSPSSSPDSPSKCTHRVKYSSFIFWNILHKSWHVACLLIETTMDHQTWGRTRDPLQPKAVGGMSQIEWGGGWLEKGGE